MTPQEELRLLLDDVRSATAESRKATDENKKATDENKLVLAKMKKTLNAFIIVAVPVVLTFFYSFVDVRTNMATMEEKKLDKAEAEQKYASKAEVVFLQNDIYDLNNAMYAMKQGMSEEKMEAIYTKALKQFMGDVTRSAE